MRGCLSLPFRLLALALLVLGGFVAWSYREEILRRVHEWTAPGAERNSVGHGDAALAPAARRKLESLGGPRDTVLLSAGELANLVAAGAAAVLPHALDSIELRLGHDDIEVRARVDTRDVPLAFGPLSGVIRDHEPIEAGGRLVYRRSGLAEWEITRARVRRFPLPREVLSRLLARVGSTTESVVPVPLPASIGGLRVSPSGVVLYATPARRP
jgi:hypothetical protein